MTSRLELWHDETAKATIEWLPDIYSSKKPITEPNTGALTYANAFFHCF